MDLLSVGAGLGIGLAALGVAAGQGLFINKIMGLLGKNPKMSSFFLTVTILGVALLESSAIYGLIVAFRTLDASFVNPLASIGVGLAIGLTGFGVGYGEGLIVEAAGDAMNKNPDERNKIMSFMILFIALVESSAIYGLIVAMQILDAKEISTYASIGTGLAIGLAGLGVAIGEGLIARNSMSAMGKYGAGNNKGIVPFTILGIALVESAAIYGLIVAMRTVDMPEASGMLAIGAGLAIGLAGLGVAIGEGLLVSKSVSEIGGPKVTSNDMIPLTVLGVALVESSAIYGLIIAMQLTGETASASLGLTSIGAGLAIGLTGLGVGIGEGYIGYRAMESVIENKNLKAKITTYMVLFIALAESVAIYGLVLANGMAGSSSDIGIAAVGAGLAIGLAGFGVTIGESILAGKSLSVMSKRSEMISFFVTVTVLGIALVESAAIYGLIIASKLSAAEAISLGLKGIGAGLAIGIAGLGVGIAEGFIVSGTFGAMARNPEVKTKFLTFMILFVALVEVLAIYGLIIAWKLV